MPLHLGEMSKLPKAYPEMYKEFMHVNIMFTPKAIVTCLSRKCQSYCIRSKLEKATIKHQSLMARSWERYFTRYGAALGTDKLYNRSMWVALRNKSTL